MLCSNLVSSVRREERKGGERKGKKWINEESKGGCRREERKGEEDDIKGEERIGIGIG